MKRINSLDVLGEVRRAQRILRRVTAYLEQQEKHERRVVKRRVAEQQRGAANCVDFAEQA